jgi:hypothetical protein
MRINSSGNVGIGTTNPQVKLHVNAGSDGIGLLIEADDSKGRIGFLETGGSDAANVIYRDSADYTVVRNFNQVYTNMSLRAPTNPTGTADREATIALIRVDSQDNDKEYLDLYNNGYASETQYGIRIQKRGTGSYRDFVFDQYDGTTKLPIMTLKAADRTVWLRSHGNVGDWTDTASIHATAAVKTTDATVTTLASITLSDGRAYHITVRVVGRKSDGTDRAFYWRAVLAYRQGGGATLQGSVVSLAAIESDTNWDCTIDASGNDIRVRVTGVASTTIYWLGTIEYQSVSTDS